ncbi:dihydrodipicolinate synthase family protein [Rhizobium tropici]|uniref:dihydrodipicolinate synthase family protein n=1 Tax=Rhizobium tropici TaxID=398 RepID=UPI001FE170C4|nr:dihydrodipicolinate synthase family protein [Rhizobium tropici]
MTSHSISSLKGIIAAIPTPITQDLEPDSEAFLDLAGHLLNEGCDGLNILGTTGEATSFSAAQRARLMQAVASRLPRHRLMVGTGAAAVDDAVALTRQAAELGFAGALILPPFYYKGIDQAGIVAFFSRIVEATRDNPIRIYLYNFPALSGVKYEAEWIATLMDKYPGRIAGLKDSSGDLDYARGLAERFRNFDVFPSNEATLMEARSGLWAGCISATANLTSRLCAQALKEGDQTALGTAVSIRKLFDGLPLVPAVKALMAHARGLSALAAVMPPLHATNPSDVRSLVARFDSL